MAEDMALRLLMASPALDVATGLVIGRLVHHDIDALLAVQDGRDRAREAVGAIRKRGWCIAEERDDMAVDCGPGAVGIRHSYDELGNLKGTKTKTGTRLLPLPDITAEGLLAAKGLQAEYFERINELRRKKGKTGSEWHLEQTDETSVITTKYSERIKPSSLSRWWSLERDNYGLDDSSLHELRHTCLTLLAEEGVHPKVMQELAGHYSSQLTMDVYTHVNMDAKREAVASASKLF